MGLKTDGGISGAAVPLKRRYRHDLKVDSRKCVSKLIEATISNSDYRTTTQKV